MQIIGYLYLYQGVLLIHLFVAIQWTNMIIFDDILTGNMRGCCFLSMPTLPHEFTGNVFFSSCSSFHASL